MKIFPILAATAVLALGACTDGPSGAGGQNRHVVIGNYTGVTMTHFYASRTTTSSWEDDIFGNAVLPSGQTSNINIDDGTGACLFDFKARFADGDEVIENDFNVCVQSTWTVR